MTNGNDLFAPAFSGLMPHAPILVPEVAGADAARCRESSAACVELARRVVAAHPDRLFLVSPHAPSRDDAFGLHEGARLAGTLAEFGFADAAVDLPNDCEALAAIAGEAAAGTLPTWDIPTMPLDHGSIVPLWFLAAAGWRGATCVGSLPTMTRRGRCAAFGAAVGRAYARLGGRVALIASGDMTHRALRGAPAGYDPRGVVFDRTMTELVRDGRLRELMELDPGLRRAAAEDSVESSIVVGAAFDFVPCGAEVLSYGHPFGVGYLVAVFHDGSGA